jgi:hypothetical protein
MNTDTLLFKPNYYNKLYRTKQRAAIFLAVCVTVLFSPKLQATTATSTNAVGSSLGLIGQVVKGEGLDSTNAIASGDTVQWTSLFESKLSSPYRSTGIMTLPKNFKWVNGSVVLPPKVTLEYSKDGGAKYEVAEPSTGTVITHVRWIISPLVTLKAQPAVVSVVDFSGTGDGYRVIPYKDNLYVVNHHISSNYINCRQAADSLPCPGFEAGKDGGLTMPSTLGASAVGYSDQFFVTPNRSIEHLDRNTGNLYVYGAIASDVYVRCLNLNTLKACSDQVFMGTNPNDKNQYAVNSMDSIGTKYYATTPGVLQGNTVKMLCYDTATKLPCKGQPYNTDWISHNNWTPGYSYDNKIYTAASSNKGGHQILQCFDTQLNSPCIGPWKNSTNDMTVRMSLFPYLDKKGAWIGFCTVNSDTPNNCLSLLKKPFSSTENYKTYLSTSGFVPTAGFHGALTNDIATNSRIFLSTAELNNHATCFDFATDKKCFPDINNTDSVWNYSIIKDPIRNDCMWSVGHESKARSFDLNTGEPCAGKPAYPPITLLDIAPSLYYNCDGSKANVTSWSAVRFSPALVWGTGGITSAKIIAINKITKKTVLEKNIPFGQYQVSINEIKYSDNPELIIQLLLESSSGASIEKEVGFDVTWDGDPIQLCFKTTAPTLENCAVEASVVQTNTQIDMPSKNEVLNAKLGLVPGETATGVGPNPTTTTLRQYPKGSSDPTQIMQTHFDLKTFTGGLNQYELLSDLTVSTKPIYDNQKLGLGSLFTSTDGSHIAYSNNFKSLSVAQQAALNKNTKGIIDGNGLTRYNAMPTKPIGPVINSSPTTLLKRSLVGYSEQQYPNYTAFKNTANRTETMVFYQGNDGLLRAYDVKSSGLAAKFSFLPGSLFLKGASRYTDATLSDLRKDPFLLDATPLISDVNLGDSKQDTKWSTVLVGNQGRGGSLVYALDVTKGNLGNLLFEYTANTDPDLKDLGNVVSPQPNDKVSGADQIVRLNNDRWAYIMGNGINSNKASKSATGTAVLYILYLNAKTSKQTTKKWLAIPVPANDSKDPNDPILFNNGLSTPRPVDINDDGSVDLVYAGDIQGNLWRFDLTDMTKVKVKKVFKTIKGEPIYTAPLVTRLPAADAICKKIGGVSDLKKCWMVSFGTGDLIDVLGKTTEEMTGVESNATQSLYGIYDAGNDTLVDNSKLMVKAINRTGVVDTVAVDYTKQSGWRLTLPTGERVTANPVLPASGSLALFATGRPLGYSANSTCYSTEGWLTAIDVSTGQQTNSFTPSSDGPMSSIPIGQPLLGNVDINPNASTTNNISTILSPGSSSATNKAPSSINLNLPTIQGRISWREVFDLPK